MKSYKVVAALVLLAAVVAIAGGCGGGSSYKSPMSSPSAMSGGGASAPVGAMPASAEATQMCGLCSKKVPVPAINGEPVMQNGEQVLKIAVVNGHYQPNQFTVKAGAPVVAVFTGKTQGCIGTPTFKSLGVTGDMSSGTATVRLGALTPGSYPLTCGMGMQQGRVTAQ